jgi:hypothetical protein
MENALAYYNAGVVCSCKFKSRRFGSRYTYVYNYMHEGFEKDRPQIAKVGKADLLFICVYVGR